MAADFAQKLSGGEWTEIYFGRYLILVELEKITMSDRSYKTFQYPTCPDKMTKIKVKKRSSAVCEMWVLRTHKWATTGCNPLEIQWLGFPPLRHLECDGGSYAKDRIAKKHTIFVHASASNLAVHYVHDQQINK